MRPRIRTLKPGFWDDRRIVGLSRDGRLTAIALTSAADDRGRLEHNIAAIRTYAFPRDKLTDRRVATWVTEVIDSGYCVAYEDAGWSYLWLPRFWRHQVINKPSESELPAHPDDPYGHLEIRAALAKFRDDSRTDSGSTTGGLPSSRARTGVPAQAGDPSLPIPSGGSAQGNGNGRSRARRGVDQTVPPEEFPAELRARLGEVLPILVSAWDVRGGVEPMPRGVGLAIMRNPRADHVAVARRLQHWLVAGRGQNARCADIAARFGDWVSDEGAAQRPGPGGGRITPSDLIREMQDQAA